MGKVAGKRVDHGGFVIIICLEACFQYGFVKIMVKDVVFLFG